MKNGEPEDQITLFDVLQQAAPEPSPEVPASAEKSQLTHLKAREVAAQKQGSKKTDVKYVGPLRTRPKRTLAKTSSGPVPAGDVRLTANIRQDIHLKLKIVAATRRTTIGDLLEELVERYL